MRRLYTLSTMLLFLIASSGFAQKATVQKDEVIKPLTSDFNSKAPKKKALSKTGPGTTTVYWSEDFSNGFAGQEDNGEWTTDGEQGDLWFYTFPNEIEGGYDPTLALDLAAYGDKIPNYFGDRAIAQSPTRDNGLMMVDGDRWNSTSTEEAPDGTLTQNAFSAELISPSMDLSEASETGARLILHQYARLCCSGYSLSVGISFDDGETYIPYDVFTPYGGGNDDIDQEISVCLVDVIQSADDLTQVRLKFSWDGTQSHYFWMIDDISIISPPLNDAEIGSTFYDRHAQTFADPETSYLDYYKSLEYQNTVDYLLKPVSIGAVVANSCSQNTQTTVTVNAIVEAPDGSTQTLSTESVDLEPGTSDTIYTDYVFLDGFNDDLIGDYSISYEVVQDQEDELPGNNIGEVRAFTTNTDQENDGFGFMQNGGNTYDGAFNQVFFGQDALVNAPYTFDEPLAENAAITHIEVVFLFAEGFAETLAGEVVYFNVREGSIGDEDEAMPGTITTTFFDSENPLQYADQDLEYIIEEADLWNSANGFPQTWVTFELPTPILIDTDVIYSPEVRIPAAGSGIVFFPVSSTNNEEQTIWLYNFSGDNVGWGTSAGVATPSMRFRTSNLSSVDKITHEAGVDLVQNYPNPAVDNTRIQYRLDETMDITFEVYDMAGKLVHTEDMGNVPAGVVQNIDFNVSALSSGMYTYSIVSENTRVTRKLTVQ